MTDQEKNQLAHLIVETYYWGPHEAYKTINRAMDDMVSDKQTDTEDFKDLEMQVRLFNQFESRIEEMAASLIPTIVQHIIKV